MSKRNEKTGAKARRGPAASRKAPAAPPRPWLRLGVRWGGAAVIVFMLLGLLVGAVVKLRDPRTLPIRTVHVEGEFRHLNRERLMEVVTPYVSGGFFDVDLRKVVEVLESLPWVHRVSLRRQWPDTLRIQVEEQRPVARWGEAALLNPYGEIFSPPAAEFPQGLVAITGPGGRERALLGRLAGMEKSLADIGQHIVRFEEDGRRAWRVDLAGGPRLSLGREHQEARLSRFIRAYPGLAARATRALEAVDLRYTNGFAVAWGTDVPGPSPQRANGGN